MFFAAGETTEERSISLGFANVAEAVNDYQRIGDLVAIEGTGGDIFVLELRVTNAVVDDGLPFLGELAEGETEWTFAVSWNSTNTAGTSQQGFLGSFSSFQEQNGTIRAEHVGAYGFDPETGAAWAVLDHSGTFAIVPEPGIAGAILVALGSLLVGRRRRD